MEICHHHIDKTQIIGIGPMMMHHHPDQATQMLYNARQFWFWLHLKHQSVKIESDWFYIGMANPPTEKEKHQRERVQEFRKEYEAGKEAVLNLIDENELSNFL